MNLIGTLQYHAATSRAYICDDVLIVDYIGPLTVRGWIAAARHGADVGHAYRYRGMLARMDQAVTLAAPLEVAQFVIDNSAIVKRRVPGAIVVRAHDLVSMQALAARMGEAGHLRRVFTDALKAFLWVRQEARFAPRPSGPARLPQAAS